MPFYSLKSSAPCIRFEVLRIVASKYENRLACIARNERKIFNLPRLQGPPATRQDLAMAKQHRCLMLGLFILLYYSNL